MKILLRYCNFVKINLDKKLFSVKHLIFAMYCLSNIVKKFFNFIVIRNDQIHIYVKKNNILNICYFLKHSIFFSCKQLLDFTIVDRIEQIKNLNR
jgi:hypothetical protein